jgi:hypothetical protein
VLTPAFATARRDAAPTPVGAMEAFLEAFLTRHRDIFTSLSISAAVHLVAMLILGVALYQSGNDTMDVPELSVQLQTHEGPNSEEFTEAALPKPAPDPVVDVLDDPGTQVDTVDAEAPGASLPVEERAPEIEQLEAPAAEAASVESGGTVLTTTSESQVLVPAIPEPETSAPAEPQPEQIMLEKNVTKLAQKLLDTNMSATSLSWEQDGQQYQARLMRQPAPDSTGLEQVVAEITTEKNGKRMKTHLSLKRLAFSHFTQLVDHWDPGIRLHDDVIDGRFHSNTEIGLAFSGGIEPRFFGKVTTAAASMTFDNFGMRRRNREVFQGGVETRTERVALPRDMPDVVRGGDKTDRRVFVGDTRIMFNADGSYAWCLANGDGTLQREEPSQRPRYLIGERGAKLYVRGTVAGIFTVYSPTDIEIEGDLTYLKDPRDTLISHDFLALISGRDIMIAAAAVTGTGDLHVHGALFARRKFWIENVEKSRAGEARLYMFGSLTAGTIMETEPRYATKIDYDKRFEYLRPAAFPMTRRYEVDSRDQGWEEVETPETPPVGSELARSE